VGARCASPAATRVGGGDDLTELPETWGLIKSAGRSEQAGKWLVRISVARWRGVVPYRRKEETVRSGAAPEGLSGGVALPAARRAVGRDLGVGRCWGGNQRRAVEERGGRRVAADGEGKRRVAVDGEGKRRVAADGL
jgi:hypothetical protein